MPSDHPSRCWNLHHSYQELPALFFQEATPEPVSNPQLFIFNTDLASQLGLPEGLEMVPDTAAILAGNQLPPGAKPIAQAYAGHQFGNFTILGDGRAILLGEQITPDARRFDIQLKGSGRTPFSRGGDGRAALGPMLREYLMSEAMHALGIATTRSLAVVGSGDRIYRQQPLPGAILTRVAASHIRVGTFEWAAVNRSPDALLALARHVLERHFPQLADSAQPALALLRAAIRSQARLIAQWMSVGFIHGVMNTDNMALSAETIDYGPCAFMDRYAESTVFSSIDRMGRYAYGNQPKIAQWNLARLAEALLPILASDEKLAITQATEALQAFTDDYREIWINLMRQKLGLQKMETEDLSLVKELHQQMETNSLDFTLCFRALTDTPDQPPHPELMEWHQQWQARRRREEIPPTEQIRIMQQHNPIYIPRNHLVEEALNAAEKDADPQPFHELLGILQNPFTAQEVPQRFTQPAAADAPPHRTFCGT